MSIATTRNGDVEIAYETIGPPAGDPLLLIMGQGGQMLDWPQDFCRLLVDQGSSVARFDNRDAGLSTHLAEAGAPSQLRMLLRPGSAAAYGLNDMAGDTAAVLDALSWRSAHIVGVSLGGMIAQTLAVVHANRVRTLTSISSAPAPRIGQPKPATLVKMIKVANPRKVKSREDFEQYLVDVARFAGSPGYTFDESTQRELARQSYDRGGFDPATVQRHTAAIIASGDRRPGLADVLRESHKATSALRLRRITFRTRSPVKRELPGHSPR